MCKNRKWAKYNKLYIFEKPLNSNMQKYLQYFQKLKFIQGKLKMCKFSSKASVQLLCKFLIKCRNPMTGSRSKDRFSRVTVK